MARRNNPSRGRKNGGGGPPAGRFRGPPRNSRPDGLGTGPYSVLAQVIQGGTCRPLPVLLPVSACPTNTRRPPAHTLADEARNTSKRPRGPLGQDAKLRYRPVTFVSAGFMNPLEELKDSPPKADDVKLDEAEPTASKADVDTIPSPAGAEPNPQEIPRDDPPVSSKEEIRPFSPSQLFTIDIAGDESLRPGRKDPVPDLPDPESDQDSDSSEEVILFKGRDAALRKAALARASASPKPRETGDSMQLHEIDVAIKVVERTITEGPPTVVKESTRQVETRRPSIPDGSPPVAPAIQEKKPMSLEALLDGNQSDEEAALIADYIANMDADEEEAQEEDDGEIDTHPGLGSHAFHLLRDLGGSDSDAIPGAVSEDENEDDDDDDDDDDDASDDEQGEEAESSQAQRRKMELGDERMARLLAKQEELGLGSDDIVLYDDADSEDGQGEWQIAPKSAPRRKKKGSSKQARIIQKKGQYPSASAMAEAFDDIDLMDWDRAALSNFNQSTQRGSQVPHVSDSELQEAMQLSFQKDRLKKAEKKKQREALRALGLLGKKMKPDDLRVKYPGGMAREDIVFELEQFLIGTDEQ